MEPDSGDPPRWGYRGARLSLADLPPSALAGSIQYRNAATALAALEALAIDAGSAAAAQVVAALDARTLAAALRRVRLAGRFQIVPGPVEWILDIAHNEPAARGAGCAAAGAAVSAGARSRWWAFWVTRMRRRSHAALRPALDRWFLCGLAGPRGISAAELARRLESIVPDPILAESVRAGCEAARAAARPGDRVVVCGSVHTVGPALEWLGVYSTR